MRCPPASTIKVDPGRKAGVACIHGRNTVCRPAPWPDTLPLLLGQARKVSVECINRLSSSEAAYIAGIIDGEGTVTLTRTHRGENRRPIVSISSTELPLLEYVRAVVGAGRITRKARARPYHSPSFAYCLSSRQALSLLRQVSGYLRTYKSQRAQLLLDHYVRVTPRNGRYSAEQRQEKDAFEARFFAVSIRAKAS